jgi:type I restriction enzyme R subunit
MVSRYTYEESVIDGVNVPNEVYTIETEISKNGDVVRRLVHRQTRQTYTRKSVGSRRKRIQSILKRPR